jgi:hypothetical protein
MFIHRNITSAPERFDPLLGRIRPTRKPEPSQIHDDVAKQPHGWVANIFSVPSTTASGKKR